MIQNYEFCSHDTIPIRAVHDQAISLKHPYNTATRPVDHTRRPSHSQHVLFDGQ